MFNLEFLRVIREAEFAELRRVLPPQARILEIGGGTGYQARCLSDAGYDVSSIDMPDGTYAAEKMDFPVQPYNGRDFPFPDATFDVVFSSNVLEHISDLPRIHAESARVLKPGGICVHVMPTGAWRFWTNVAHYTELLQQLAFVAWRARPYRLKSGLRARLLDARRQAIDLWRHYRIVPRHGEVGNALIEVYTFSTFYWKQHFRQHRFDSLHVRGNRIFYTGHMVLGRRLGIGSRHWLSYLLGSACGIHVLRPPQR